MTRLPLLTPISLTNMVNGYKTGTQQHKLQNTPMLRLPTTQAGKGISLIPEIITAAATVSQKLI